MSISKQNAANSLKGEAIKLGDRVIYHPCARDRVNKLRIAPESLDGVETVQIGTVSHIATVAFVGPNYVNLSVLDSKGVPYIALNVTDNVCEDNTDGWYEALV